MTTSLPRLTTDADQAQLLEHLNALTARVQELEERLAALDAAELAPEVVLAISAAVAAYLGKRAVVKQVRLRRGSAWASQGRSDVQHSHAIHKHAIHHGPRS